MQLAGPNPPGSHEWLQSLPMLAASACRPRYPIHLSNICLNINIGPVLAYTALLNPKTSVIIRSCHPYTGNPNTASESEGECSHVPNPGQVMMSRLGSTCKTDLKLKSEFSHE